MRLRALTVLLGVTLLSGCGAGDEGPDRGAIVVTVTLTRSGPPGPSIDQRPQRGVDVTVSDPAGHRWSAVTDAAGEAHLSVPPGDYLVEVASCPDAPKPVTVTSGATSRTRFDCVAA